MSTPIVSVVVPTHNRPTTLQRAIQSILDQTVRDLEVVVVDDASEPPINSIIEEFNDSRIRCIRLSENRGASASRNVGIEEAEGQFISFLDDDDIYLGEKIEKQLEVFGTCSRSVGLVYCGYICRDENGRYLWKKVPKRTKWMGLHHRELLGIAPLVRRQCFKDVGFFDEKLTFYEDADMWYRISQKYDFAFSRDILYEVTAHPLSREKGLHGRLESLDWYYRKHRKESALLPKRTQDKMSSTYHWHRACAFYLFDRIDGMRNEAFKAVRSYPFSFRYWTFVLYGSVDERWRNTFRALFRKVKGNLSRVSSHTEELRQTELRAFSHGLSATRKDADLECVKGQTGNAGPPKKRSRYKNHKK